MRVKLHQSSDDSAWQEFVNQHGDACLEHDIAWQRIFADTYGYGQRYLVLEDDGGMAGVLPLFSVQVWRMGRCLLSMPFLDCGGPLVASLAHRAHLLEAAKRLGEKESAAYVEMRMLEQAGGGVPTRTDKAKLVLDLAQDAAGPGLRRCGLVPVGLVEQSAVNCPILSQGARPGSSRATADAPPYGLTPSLPPDTDRS